MFGLIQRDIELIKHHILSIEGIDSAYIFGSRALGNYKRGSDIDIAVLGNSIERNSLLKVIDTLNEVEPIPYFIDIINFNTITNSKLQKHILEEGQLIVEKKPR